ncbi:MAG: pantetheine-phosphate adenylyltransferase [Buchnera aphidicola (Schlechtendalia peitan)]
MEKKILYPGTFDPITFGHLDIIHKVSKIFNFIIIAIFENLNKKPLFTIHERIKFIKKTTKTCKCVKKIISFDDLLIHIAKSENVNHVVRGIRTSSDLEYECNMFNINKKLYPKLEHILFFSSPKYSCISSSLVKEIAKYKGNIKSYIPKLVYYALLKKIKNKNI